MSWGGKRARIGSFCYTPAWIVSVTSVRISQAWKRDDCLSAILCPRVYTFVGTGTLSLMINPSVGTGTGRFETRLHTGQNPQHFRYLCAAKQSICIICIWDKVTVTISNPFTISVRRIRPMYCLYLSLYYLYLRQKYTLVTIHNCNTFTISVNKPMYCLGVRKRLSDCHFKHSLHSSSFPFGG